MKSRAATGARTDSGVRGGESVNFDFDDITGAIGRIIIILIGIAVVVCAFGLAGIVVRALMEAWA